MAGKRTERARKMRREPTEAEALLWKHLRNRQVSGAKFRRQAEILGYYADYLCEEARLIIEADGGQHTPETDADRTRDLEAAGYLILRFWNNDILQNPEGVIHEICATLQLRE